MSGDRAAALAERRIALREQLHAQRSQLARQLRAGSGYPRSLTMRWLIPGLLTRLAIGIVGRRAALALPVVLTVVRSLRANARQEMPLR